MQEITFRCDNNRRKQIPSLTQKADGAQFLVYEMPLSAE